LEGIFRKWISIGPPDIRRIVFIDQVVFAVEEESGSKLVTSDGSTHIFNSIAFDEMVKMLTQ
jgi:hypothetical protein